MLFLQGDLVNVSASQCYTTEQEQTNKTFLSSVVCVCALSRGLGFLQRTLLQFHTNSSHIQPYLFPAFENQVTEHNYNY